MDGDSEIKSGDKAAVIPATEEGKEGIDEMPPTYDEAKGLTTGEAAVKITSNETKIDIGKEKEADQGFQGLTKDELMKYANDPYWVRLRWILFILFWVIWVAMLVASVVIIIYAPKCPSPEPKQWWQKSPVYKVDVGKFEDSDADGEGDLAGVQSKLDYLVETGVGTVYLSAFFQSPRAATDSFDIQDYKSVASEFGSLEDWKALVAALKERDQKVVIDFIPNHTSDKHEWFEMSIAEDPAYVDFYIWNEGGGADSPPNDWTGVSGGSAWSWSGERGAWYLHQFGENQPDLNLANPAVVAELEKVLQFWISTGVNGFVINDVPYMVDAPVSAGNDKSISRQVEILKKFRAVVDAETEDSGIPCVLYANVDLPVDQLSALYGDEISESNVGSLVHLPLAPTLLATSSDITAVSLKEAFDQYMLVDLPVNAWPSFTLSSTQFGPELVDPLTMFKMLLPGTSMSVSGEELGLVDEDFWTSVDAQKAGSMSHLKVFSTLANKLRHQEAILFGEVTSNSTFVMEDTVFGLTRCKKGNPGYVLAINFGEEEKTVDMSMVERIPGSIRLMTRSIQAGEVQGVETVEVGVEEVKRFDSNSVLIKPKEGRLFTFVPNFD
eukprot:GFUD01041155.1.p1 GENE.GFUD01041155.1~~GFUD01041155.1.p1  ORF type:complete len:610 (+),score=196.00 GFUD01041155.1:268-2097(+)